MVPTAPLARPDALPTITELQSNYRLQRMTLAKRRRAIFRHRKDPGRTVIVVELEDGGWHIDRLNRGVSVASKVLKRLPWSHYELVTGRPVPPWVMKDRPA